jgi:hypothetical protein
MREKEELLARYWINQPSTLQPCHYMHGRNVLALENPPYEFVTVYFVEGPTISARIPKLALSPGWREPRVVESFEETRVWW